MKTFACVAAALLALMASSTVSASSCLDVCHAECNLVEEICHPDYKYNELCKGQVGICSELCVVFCVCREGCALECTADYNKCKRNGKPEGAELDDLDVLACGFALTQCNDSCKLNCHINPLTGIFSSLVAGKGTMEKAWTDAN